MLKSNQDQLCNSPKGTWQFPESSEIFDDIETFLKAIIELFI